MIAVEPVVSIQNLHKIFFVEGEGDKASFSFTPIRFLRHFMRLLFFPESAAGKWSKSVVALTDINLDVMPGEMVGIIGDNGAGKTTLLKILAGVLRPSRGSICVRGRMASLVDLGGEFSKEMTVRENVSFACALAGMSGSEGRVAKARILEWAELEEEEDTLLGRCTPGQIARLAFATTMIGDPEVILADEILTVGDGDFRRDCEERIDRASHSGGAVLFVSHDLDAIKRSCTRVVWLERGGIRAVGSPDFIVDEYIRETIPTHAATPTPKADSKYGPQAEQAPPVCSLVALSVHSLQGKSEQTITADGESLLECSFEIAAVKTTYNLTLELWEDGHFLASLVSPRPFSVLKQTAMKAQILLPSHFFTPGVYSLHAVLLSPKSANPDASWKIQTARKYRFFVDQPLSSLGSPVALSIDRSAGTVRYSVGVDLLEQRGAELSAKNSANAENAEAVS